MIDLGYLLDTGERTSSRELYSINDGIVQVLSSAIVGGWESDECVEELVPVGRGKIGRYGGGESFKVGTYLVGSKTGTLH